MGETSTGAGTDGFHPDDIERLVDTAVNPFVVIDTTSKVVWASQSIEELLGTTAAELVGASLIDRIAPSSLAQALEYMAAAETYLGKRPGSVRGWEGAGPSLDFLHADGRSVTCSLAVATPRRTGLRDIVIQLRRAGSTQELEHALVAMSRGEDLTTVLAHVAGMFEGAFGFTDVVIVHDLTPDGHVDTIGGPSSLRDLLHPDVLGTTPWLASLQTPGRLVEMPISELPEPYRSAAEEAGYLWLGTLVASTGTAAKHAMIATWSRRPFELNPFTQDHYHRCAHLVGLVVQWHEGRRALEWAATHDVLTGLHNRLSFVEQLRASAREVDRPVTAVLYLDLDDFKPVNDRFGHALGDEVLTEVARRLGESVRPTDIVARLGGDEFAVLCPALADLDHARQLADRLVEKVAEPIPMGGVDLRIGLSVGIAEVAADEPEMILARADAALRSAKEDGKSRWASADDPRQSEPGRRPSSASGSPL